jgi:hypothetical protein
VGFYSLVFESARIACFSHVGMMNTVLANCGMTYLMRKYVSTITMIVVAFTSFFIAKIASDTRRAVIEKEFLERKEAIDMYAAEIRKTCIPKTLLVAGTIIIGLKGISLWNSYRLQNLPHSLDEESVDKQTSWLGSMLDSIGFKTKPVVKNASPEHVRNAIGKNLFTLRYRCGDRQGLCNIFFVQKFVALVPKHIFYPDGNLEAEPRKHLDCVVRRNNKASSNFKFRVSYSTCAPIAMKDAVLLFVPNCPDVKNITKWLPFSHGKGLAHCHFIMRDENGDLQSDNVAVQHAYTGHKYMPFDGGYYKTPLARKGNCMAVLYSESKDSSILGFHIGGDETGNDGVMQTITSTEVLYAKTWLETVNEVGISSSATELPEKCMGVNVLDTKTVHPHAKIFHNLPEASPIDLHGSTALRAQSKSQVVPSILSKQIEEKFGVPNKWGPPKLLPNWEKYNATLQYVIDPIDFFDPEDLLRAKRDYLKPLKQIAYKTKDIKALTDKEAILGQDGKRFVDALPMKTSMGFPIYGPKSKYFTEVREGEKLIDRIPDPVIVQEVNRMKNCWMKGERAYPICTATLKDEPTPLDKEKVRVFQASNTAMSLCIRKYFLPIIRFLGIHPLDSESAVGVNSVGKQWQDLMKYVRSKSHNGMMMAGDYSKYDVRMSSQLTYMAWSIMIEIADDLDYSLDDLQIMRNMIADIIHPVIDWNGTLISAYNLNTSGNNCTVQINDIVNSLLVRMGFFHVCPEKEDFRKYVALITYGDDFLASCSQEVEDRFHFESYKNFLASKNMKITLPSKTDEVRRFLPVSECDFLKRKGNFIPEIDRELGALDEDSIFRSLHANLKSKTETPTQVAISCIETAMHEWFAHGKEVYEDRQEKMKLVCEHLSLAVPAVHISFEERVQRWKDTYDK